MIEAMESKYYKRVSFPKGGQKEFLEKIQAQLNLKLKEIVKLVGVHVRSITDWKREKYSMSLPALERLCKEARISPPSYIKVKDPFWYTNKGGKAGGTAVYKKYGRIGGDPVYRKKKWYEWWEKEGQFKKHPIINVFAPVDFPRRSTKLAEFVGILLGDGGITSSQITITLHKNDDRKFALYVQELIKGLFGIVPSFYKRENTVSIVISRTKIVKFFNNMGIPIGGKVRQQTDVPSWIKKSKKFTKFCLRGLFDTDGCFYIDKHRYKEKIYYNCGINFTNRSLPILSYFKENIQQLGFHPTQKTKFSVFLRKENEIKHYFQKIGSSNPKHLDKFKHYFNTIRGGVG